MTPTPPEIRDRDLGAHLDDHLLIDLTFGLLPAEESVSALSHLRGCVACEERFRTQTASAVRRRSRERIRIGAGGGVQLEPVAEPDAVDSPDRGVAAKPFDFWSRLRAAWGRPALVPALGTAMAIAIVLILILPRTRDQDFRPSDLHGLPQVSGEVRLRAASDGTASPRLVEGLRAYDRGDPHEAVRLLEDATASGNWETIRKIYLGSALAQDGDFSRAAELLLTIEGDAAPDPWAAESQWNLYVSLRELGRSGKADSLLRRLRLEPGEVGERARQESMRRTGGGK